MKKIIFTYLLIGLFLIGFGSADVSEDQAAAVECLLESEGLIEDLFENDYSILRVEDTQSKAQQVFEAQKVIIERGINPNFYTVLEYCDDLVEIYDLAIESRDSFDVLMGFYDLSLTDDMDKSTVDVIIDEIESEIESERYEKVVPLVDRAYDEISEIQRRESTLNTFYSTTTRGVKVFFLRTWKSILIGLGVFVLLIIFYGTAFRRYLTKRKIKHLETRRIALKNYLKKTQRLYFETGNLSESEYELRTENFANMVREIDRQIPLLNERLIKYSHKRDNKLDNEKTKKAKRRSRNKE